MADDCIRCTASATTEEDKQDSPAEKQYLETKESQRPPIDMQNAVLDKNIAKNRYANILPPDETRVHLTGEEGKTLCPAPPANLTNQCCH